MASNLVQYPGAGCIVEFMQGNEPQIAWVMEEQKGKPKNTYVGELYFTAHRGTYTTQAAVKKGNRKSELALRELEMWSVPAAIAGGEYPAAEAEALSALLQEARPLRL